MFRILFSFILIFAFIFTHPQGAYALEPDFYIERAKHKISEENYQGAIEDLTKAGYMSSNNFEVYLLQAQAKEKMGNIKAAILDYTFCIKIVSQNSSLESQKAIIFADMAALKQSTGDNSGALEDFTKAMAIFKRKDDFQNYKKVAESIKAIENVIPKKQQPQDEQIFAEDYMKLAKAAFQNADYNQVIMLTTKALELDPLNPSIFKSRAMSKANLKDFDGALSDLYSTRDLYEKQKNFEGYESTFNAIEKIKSFNTESPEKKND